MTKLSQKCGVQENSNHFILPKNILNPPLLYYHCATLVTIAQIPILSLSVPPSEVTLVTDTVHQPILSQSNVTLVCSVEFSPLVDAAVTVYTNFTGPHSGQITTATMEKHTKYVGRADLTNMKPSHSGTYRCESSAISSSPYIRRAQNSGAANKHLAIGMTLIA